VGRAVVGERTVYYGDLTTFEHPRDRLLASAVREGDPIPRWEPGLYGGAPTLAAQEMALLYPPNTLVAWLCPDRARAIGLFLHFVLASLGSFALARELGASPRAALLAALVYGSGGAIVSMTSVPVYVRSAAFLPWVLLAAARGSTALATTALLGTYLAGDPFGCVIAALASLAVRPSLAIAKGAGLAVLLGAAQLLPSLAVLDETARAGGYLFDYATQRSLWPPELAGLVVPFLFGTRVQPQSLWAALAFPGLSWYETVYVGPIAFALAVAGAVKGNGPARRAGLLLLIFIIPAFGKCTPLANLVHLFIEKSPFRFPAKIFMPAALGLALLAASGLDKLPRKGLAIGLAALGVALLVALRLVAGGDLHLDTSRIPGVDEDKVMGALALRIGEAFAFAVGGCAVAARGRRASLGLLLLAGLDLAIALGPSVPTAPERFVDREPACAAILRELGQRDGVPARVLPTPAARAPTQAEVDVAMAEIFNPDHLAQSLSPDAGLGDGVYSQLGFLSNEPLRPARLAALLHDLENGVPTDVLDALSGARYVLAAPGEDRGDPVAEVEGRRLLRLRRAPPWAAVHPRVRSAPDLLATLDAIAEDPKRALDEPVIEGVAATFDGPVRAAKLVSPFTRHRFELEADGPGWLVVHESYARGWRAHVDGAEAAIVPANVAFRAVFLPAGNHRIAFDYVAPRALAGAIVSALTAAALAARVLVSRRRARISLSPPAIKPR
jgi:hypothetical protein